MTFDRAQILAEIITLTGYREPPQDSITVADFMAATGKSHAAALRTLKRLVEAGQLESVKVDGQWYFWTNGNGNERN